MLMAAGLGTRMLPFTQFLAKPILPLMGVPIAQFALDQLADAGVKKVVANIHHQAQATGAFLRSLDLHGMELILSDESKMLLGGAGGIKKALEFLGDKPFYLMNADVISDVRLQQLGRFHETANERWGATITFALHPGVPHQDQYSEFCLDRDQGRITSLGRKATHRPFWTGTAVIDPAALLNVPPSGPADFVTTILEPAIQSGTAAGIFAPSDWYDIGSPHLWWHAHLDLINKLETGKLPLLWRRRIENAATRLAEGVWTTHFFKSSMRSSEWDSPCFLGHIKNTDRKSPRFLGPSAVYYGEAIQDIAFKSGIGYSGAWVDFKKS